MLFKQLFRDGSSCFLWGVLSYNPLYFAHISNKKCNFAGKDL